MRYSYHPAKSTTQDLAVQLCRSRITDVRDGADNTGVRVHWQHQFCYVLLSAMHVSVLNPKQQCEWSQLVGQWIATAVGPPRHRPTH